MLKINTLLSNLFNSDILKLLTFVEQTEKHVKSFSFYTYQLGNDIAISTAINFIDIKLQNVKLSFELNDIIRQQQLIPYINKNINIISQELLLFLTNSVYNIMSNYGIQNLEKSFTIRQL